MAISSNTLFKFVNKSDYLLDILENKFHPRFSLENFENLISDQQNDWDLEYAIPMICFCDIPLSQASDHFQVYGEYGIGLSKEWGMQTGITPVLYLHPKSILSSNVKALLSRIHSNRQDASRQEMLDDVFKMTCFIKPYEGKFWRDGNYLDNVRFYDEREWRYVPWLEGQSSRYGISKDDFFDKEKRKMYNEMLLYKKHTIKFEPSDIKYIIVSCEDEIIPMISKIIGIKSKYDPDQINLLTTRIISAERIREDF